MARYTIDRLIIIIQVIHYSIFDVCNLKAERGWGKEVQLCFYIKIDVDLK